MNNSPVKDNVSNRKKCLCPICPSYPKKCSGEVLYCSRDASKCDIKPQGCVCGGCPVAAENNLTKLYYCDKTATGNSQNLLRKKNSNEDPKIYKKIVVIKDLANTGQNNVVAMGSNKKMPFSFNDIHFVPAQVSKIPLNKEETVNTKIIIGPKAKKPLKLSSPIIISGLSFGAVSKNVKLVISQVAKNLGIGFNSGEGGLLPEDYRAKNYLIGQYATGRFGINDKVLKSVAAVEIRFGQGAYPGKGSYLPANKITPEIAKIRGLKKGEAAYSPAHHFDMLTPAAIANKVNWLKKITGGVPIGAKIGCGNIEEDIKILVDAKVDFIALDGFGGGTGATDLYIRENVGIPLIAALPRAVKILKDLKVKNKVSLIAGGGLRFACDYTKCLALGVDAVYIGTAALIAINCEQYRICHTGHCPTGIATNNPMLMKQLDVAEGVRKLTNFIKISTAEIANFTRITGKDDILKLNSNDVVSLNKDLAQLTGLKWLNNINY